MALGVRRGELVDRLVAASGSNQYDDSDMIRGRIHEITELIDGSFAAEIKGGHYA